MNPIRTLALTAALAVAAVGCGGDRSADSLDDWYDAPGGGADVDLLIERISTMGPFYADSIPVASCRTSLDLAESIDPNDAPSSIRPELRRFIGDAIGYLTMCAYEDFFGLLAQEPRVVDSTYALLDAFDVAYNGE